MRCFNKMLDFFMLAEINNTRELVVPVGWLIGIIGILGSTITALAGIIWHTLKDRLAIQDKIIEKLQDDVDRLSKGCGHQSCIWKSR